MVCPNLTCVLSGRGKAPLRDEFYLVHGSGVIFSVSFLEYFVLDVSMLRMRLTLFDYTCARGWMKDWKGFGISRDPNMPSLFIQQSSTPPSPNTWLCQQGADCTL